MEMKVGRYLIDGFGEVEILEVSPSKERVKVFIQQSNIIQWMLASEIKIIEELLPKIKEVVKASKKTDNLDGVTGIEKDENGVIYLLNNGQKTKCPQNDGFCSSLCPHFEYRRVQERQLMTERSGAPVDILFHHPEDYKVWHEPTGIVIHRVQLTCGGQSKVIDVGRTVGGEWDTWISTTFTRQKYL